MRPKIYHDMENSRADMTDFCRPPYAVQRAIRVQAEQIRETPAEYVARKYGIRGDVDGRLQHGRLSETGSGSGGDGCHRLHKGAETAPQASP